MPSIEVVPSPASSEHPDRLLFKSRKSLPRRINSNSRGQIPQPSPSQDDVHFSDGLPLTAAPILPLTPPGIAQDESPTGADVQKPTLSSPSVITVLTPSRPSRPPTPETTPPRAMASNRPGLTQFGYISSSSRAESFKTAHETMSDAETVTPRPSPPLLSRSNTQRSTKSTKSSQGNRTDAGTGVPATKEPFRGPRRSKVETGIEEQLPATIDVSCKQGLANGQASDLCIESTRDKSKRSRNTAEPNVTDIDVSTRGRRSLRDRVAHVTEDSPALDQFRQEIGWPSADDQLARLEEPRRLSGVSTPSTIEAVIVDKPKPARRALRHTEKRLSLRSASSPITKSERTSIASSSDLQRRLSHKPVRITENDRRSIASELSVSGSSTLGVPQQPVDVVPVVVIPQRHSSLKGPSNPPSRNTSTSRSRPTIHAPIIPKSRADSLDLPRGKRTVSDSRVSDDDRGRGLSRPHIPPRSSSLSAPTSQNNSRATSLTSESLQSYNLAIEQVKKRQQPEKSKPASIAMDATSHDEHDTSGILTTQSIVIGVEDMSYLRPPSVPFTPHSIPSSSPGPFEISEVRRVAIFPHNNESLLLVNPHVQRGLRGQLQQAGQPQTPDNTQETTNVDSPLRNPRPPPKPPVSITAGNFVNFDQLLGEVTNGIEPANGINSRPRSKRRSRIARPRSESFNSFVRTLSLSSAKNPKAGEDIDGRSQPFWRPRRFWDDSPESLSSEEGGSRPRNFKQPDEIISNSLGMPQKRIVFDGPPITPARPGAKRRTDSHHRANRRALMGNRIFSPEALYSQTSLHQRRFPVVSWWRLRFRSGITRSLRWRLRSSMQQRAEGRREVRREKLKQSIGEAVLMDSSTQVRKAVQ
ncbi:hypothetical protein BDW71DRAFT_125166 [Aspergillus fruticulosus]